MAICRLSGIYQNKSTAYFSYFALGNIKTCFIVSSNRLFIFRCSTKNLMGYFLGRRGRIIRHLRLGVKGQYGGNRLRVYLPSPLFGEVVWDAKSLSQTCRLAIDMKCISLPFLLRRQKVGQLLDIYKIHVVFTACCQEDGKGSLLIPNMFCEYFSIKHQFSR